jgi:hypothetical protein
MLIRMVVWIAVLGVGILLGLYVQKYEQRLIINSDKDYFTSDFLKCENPDELERVFRRYSPNFEQCSAAILALTSETDSSATCIQLMIYHCLHQINELTDAELQQAQLIEPLIVAFRRSDTEEVAELACSVLNRVCQTNVVLDRYALGDRLNTAPVDRPHLGKTTTEELHWKNGMLKKIAGWNGKTAEKGANSETPRRDE